MGIITPTITAEDTHYYREQIERLEGFAKRIHIDLMDGIFAPSKSIGIDKIFWSDKFEQVDIHLMYQNPEEYINKLIGLRPDIIILHAEANNVTTDLLGKIKDANIKTGVSLLKDSKVSDYQDLVRAADHVLIFSGNLGYFGGKVDLNLLDKVGQIKDINKNTEIGWDGGINDQNIEKLMDGGVEVLNVGGYIQNSEDPKANFEKLQIIAEKNSCK